MPCKVEDLTESGATNDSVSASWTAPSGEYDGFNVTCSNGSFTETQTLDASTTSFTCTGLPTCGADYNMTITTLSGNKESEPCYITITAGW